MNSIAMRWDHTGARVRLRPVVDADDAAAHAALVGVLGHAKAEGDHLAHCEPVGARDEDATCAHVLADRPHLAGGSVDGDGEP